MPNPTNSEALRSFFVYVKDTNTNKITRIAIPSDLQVGTLSNPSALDLLGRLSLSSTTYTITSAGTRTLNLKNHDTIAEINLNVTLTAGSLEVILPEAPQNGQIHFIKDATGTAASQELIITGSDILIDGETSIRLRVDYGSLAVYYLNGSWHILIQPADGSSDTDWIENGTELKTSSSVSISSDSTFASSKGDDVYFYVSGTIDTSPSASARVAVFGGDVRVSGSVSVGSSSIKITSNDIQFGGDFSKRFEYNDPNILVTAPFYTLGGLTGSLQQVSVGVSYLAGGGIISIISQSNGQIIISGAAAEAAAAHVDTTDVGADITVQHIKTYTTASFIVPDGVTSVSAKLWGAGGGTGVFANDGGASGGYAAATISVTPGEELLIIVGTGGEPATGSAGIAGLGGFGGGGDGGMGDASGGGGGGYTGIFTGSIEQVNAILIAAGGGGGTGFAAGGAGGGTDGNEGTGANPGGGASQTAGGTGGSASGGLDDGTELQGGRAEGSRTTTTAFDAGGGGGGYWGGGGGTGDASGGGGGSGFLNTDRVTETTLSLGTDGDDGGGSVLPPNTVDVSYVTGIGTGSAADGAQALPGGDGLAVLTYAIVSTYPAAYWADLGDALILSSTTAFGGTAAATTQSGVDTFVFVSGTINKTGVSAKKAVFGGDVVVTGSIVAGAFGLTLLTPDSISGDHHDYYPDGFESGSIIRIDCPTAASISGMSASLYPRVIRLVNIGSGTLTIKNDNADSEIQNRIMLNSGGDYAMDENLQLECWYDTVSQRWRGNDSFLKA